MTTKLDAVKARTAELMALRKNRDPHSLDHFGTKRLDKYSADQLDTENYVYCYQNDEKNNIPKALERGYEFVETSEIHNYKTYDNNGESSSRVREYCGKDEENQKQYTYLMKIPKAVWDYDQAVQVKERSDRMKGILTNVDPSSLPNVDSSSVGDGKGVYSVEGNQATKTEPLATQTVKRSR